MNPILCSCGAEFRLPDGRPVPPFQCPSCGQTLPAANANGKPCLNSDLIGDISICIDVDEILTFPPEPVSNRPPASKIDAERRSPKEDLDGDSPGA
jgi:hypothetical protein